MQDVLPSYMPTVRKLVATDRAERAIAEILGHVRIVEDWMLHDAGRKDDLITGRVIVCVHSRYGHPPLVMPGWFAEPRPFLFDFELSHLKAIVKVGGI